mmetsp:Transcript_25181/g.47572  ORF Transcript_25181/g.47572 Transcript_25181/m.47572 type:complete len:252 (+) Transcript_25181:599-1354(+)
MWSSREWKILSGIRRESLPADVSEDAFWPGRRKGCDAPTRSHWGPWNCVQTGCCACSTSASSQICFADGGGPRRCLQPRWTPRSCGMTIWGSAQGWWRSGGTEGLGACWRGAWTTHALPPELSLDAAPPTCLRTRRPVVPPPLPGPSPRLAARALGQLSKEQGIFARERSETSVIWGGTRTPQGSLGSHLSSSQTSFRRRLLHQPPLKGHAVENWQTRSEREPGPLICSSLSVAEIFSLSATHTTTRVNPW